MTKPSIRRARTDTGDLADGWILTRPAYGFGPSTIERHTTWREAHTALDTAPATSSANLGTQTAGYVPGLTTWRGSRAHRPRWIET